MPNWGQIVAEVQQSGIQRGTQGPDLDGLRLKYIQRLHDLTGRAVIVYASGWLKAAGHNSPSHLVEANDIHALMEVCHGVPERQLDLIIHSPGGSAEAAEQMVNYLRTRFDYIRAIVPLQAKSAGTMLALGCDEIVMGAHSELGPIDPQLVIPLPGGGRYAPAHAILRDFKRAKEEIAQDVNSLATWTPILHAYAGGLLEFCTQQIQLSQEIVSRWLVRYMLSHDDAGVPEDERKATADQIAKYFGSEESYDRFRTHGRPIRIEELETVKGLRIRRLENDHGLQDAVLSIYHLLDVSFSQIILKIVENHRAARYVRIEPQIVLKAQPPMPVPQPGQSPPPRPQKTPQGQNKRRRN